MPLYAKVEGYARSKLFWAVVVIIACTLYILSPVVQVSYLTFPFVYLLLSVFALAGMASLSVPLAVNYVRFHMWFYKKKNVKYETDKSLSFSFPKVRSMIISGTMSVVGMTYLVVSTVYFIDQSSAIGFVITILLFITFLSIAPTLNVSTVILRKSSRFYYNPNDGTKMNLGTDLANRISWVIGPLALVRLIFLEVTNFPNVGVGFTLLGFAILIAIPALALGFFHLKNRLPFLADKLDKELDKLAARSIEGWSPAALGLKCGV